MAESIRLNDGKYWDTSGIMYNSSTPLSSVMNINNIVESGSNDNGTWVHLNSGLLICVKQMSYSGIGIGRMSITSASYANYYCLVGLGASPKAFASQPGIILQAVGTGSSLVPYSSCALDVGPTDLGIGCVYFRELPSGNLWSGSLNIIAFGAAA